MLNNFKKFILKTIHSIFTDKNIDDWNPQSVTIITSLHIPIFISWILKVKKTDETRVIILIIEVNAIITNVGILRNCFRRHSENDSKFPTTPTKQKIIETFWVKNSTGILKFLITALKN